MSNNTIVITMNRATVAGAPTTRLVVKHKRAGNSTVVTHDYTHVPAALAKIKLHVPNDVSPHSDAWQSELLNRVLDLASFIHSAPGLAPPRILSRRRPMRRAPLAAVPVRMRRRLHF
jgi:hypothetical protein